MGDSKKDFRIPFFGGFGVSGEVEVGFFEAWVSVHCV